MSDLSSRKIGAFWVKQSNDTRYLSGQIEVNGKKIPVVLFKNQNKKLEKHPDWELYKTIPQDIFDQ